MQDENKKDSQHKINVKERGDNKNSKVPEVKKERVVYTKLTDLCL